QALLIMELPAPFGAVSAPGMPGLRPTSCLVTSRPPQAPTARELRPRPGQEACEHQERGRVLGLRDRRAGALLAALAGHAQVRGQPRATRASWAPPKALWAAGAP